MANWYGIDGIELHYNGPCEPWWITFNGVTDSSGVTVEETMWEMFTDSNDSNDYEDESGEFSQYMRDNADVVKELILMVRGEL